MLYCNSYIDNHSVINVPFQALVIENKASSREESSVADSPQRSELEWPSTSTLEVS